MAYTCAYCGETMECGERGDDLTCETCTGIAEALAGDGPIYVFARGLLHKSMFWRCGREERFLRVPKATYLYVTEFEAFLRGVRRLEGPE